MSRVLLLFVACLAIASGKLRRFDNHHVYRVTVQNTDQLSVLQKLDGLSDKIVFLDGAQQSKRPLNVIVDPSEVSSFVEKLDGHNIAYELLEENAQSKLEADDDVASGLSRATDYNWEQYHTLEDTYNWLESLVERFPEQVQLIEAGRTYEGRKILGVKISYKSGNQGVFIEGGMHAREWIGPATVTYITNQLLTSDNPDIRLVAENFDWYIVPHANPDGFVYTHTTDRLWRKTRSPQANDCFGADPNRNWDFYWNTVGASDNPCSETYAGPSAFSEIETKSLADYIATLEGKLLLYVSFHSYSQLLLFPYGHTGELPKNYHELKRIYDVAVNAIATRYGTKYTGGNIYDAIYPAAGASVDWVYGTLDVKLGYCYELRPSSLNFWYGFKLPAAQIIPTAEETVDSLVAMVREAGVDR